jgi:SAM-dependent methyltransferase
MAKAFPNSRFVGFDYHDASIKRAKQAAKEADAAANTEFQIAKAQDFKGDGFDLIACFDCLHDMGDPVGAAKHIRQALKPDGSFMLVEPMAGDALEDNMNVVGRLFYSASTMICTPASLSQEVGLGLGAQAGEKRLGEVLKEGGFKTVRRAVATPFNLILEAKP